MTEVRSIHICIFQNLLVKNQSNFTIIHVLRFIRPVNLLTFCCLFYVLLIVHTLLCHIVYNFSLKTWCENKKQWTIDKKERKKERKKQ